MRDNNSTDWPRILGESLEPFLEPPRGLPGHSGEPSKQPSSQPTSPKPPSALSRIEAEEVVVWPALGLLLGISLCAFLWSMSL